MTAPDGSSFYKQIVEKRKNRAVRQELIDSLDVFMSSIGHIVNDVRLTAATDLFWEPIDLRNVDRVHSFECEGARAIELEAPNWSFVGKLIVPNKVIVVIDDKEVQYHFGQYLPDTEGDPFRDLLLTFENPHNIVHASWKADVGEYVGAEEKGHKVTLPPNRVMSHENNSNFDGISDSVQTALSGASFTRIDTGF